MKYLTHETKYTTYKKCYFKKGEYLQGGKMSLLLVDEIEGPVTDITINVPEINIPEGCDAIKNYSENEGMLDWLKENNLIKEVVTIIPYNFITIPIVEFNREELNKYIIERDDSDDE